MTKLFSYRVGRLWVFVASGIALLLTACGAATPTQADVQPTVGPTTVVRLPVAPLPEFSTAITDGYLAPPTAPPLPTATIAPTADTTLLPPVAGAPEPDLAFSGDNAYAYLEAYMQFQPRYTGAPGWQQAGDYIVEQTTQAGWQVEEQRFPYKGVNVRNIIAKRGSGPLLIIGAHYDARKYADRDPDTAKQREPVPGANDGGSGVAVLLELAKHINTDQLGREVWLTFFDAEDNGEIEGWDWVAGSTYLAEHLPRKPEAMILLDMIGDADLQIPYEQTSNDTLKQSIWQTAAELGYQQFIPEQGYAITDDHTPFLERGIPAVDLIDFNYPAWHTVGDTADKVSPASLEAVGRTMERWLETRARP